MSWINTDESLPEPETTVLIKVDGNMHLAALEWEKPMFEETFQPFLFWLDTVTDCSWDQAEVDHWYPIPKELFNA